MEGLIDDNRVLISLIACSRNPETPVTFTHGHFNKVVFAVLSLIQGGWKIPSHVRVGRTNERYYAGENKSE